jgi:hypothetical protein
MRLRLHKRKQMNKTAGEPRYGMMVLVAEGQKTNAILGVPQNCKTSKLPSQFQGR